jgi:hypothetical protein
VNDITIDIRFEPTYGGQQEFKPTTWTGVRAMMLTFLSAMGLGVFLGIRLCRRPGSHRYDNIDRQIDIALADPRTIEEMLDDIERLNVPEREINIYPRWQIVDRGEFKW